METLNNKAISFPVHPIMENWKTLQDGHEAVVRWGGYVECNPNLPKQTNLHHMVSVKRLFYYFLGHLKTFFATDYQLVMDAIEVHEDGEASKRQDVLYHNKTSIGHLEEFEAFRKMLVGDEVYTKRMERAFLLQFVLDKDFILEGKDRACKVLKKLRNENQHEATLFNLLERFDYYLYAVRAYQEFGDVVILVHVLRNQSPYLDTYSRLIPGISDMLWTLELESSTIEFLQKYKDIPGPKDEGGIPAAYAYAVEKGYMTI